MKKYMSIALCLFISGCTVSQRSPQQEVVSPVHVVSHDDYARLQLEVQQLRMALNMNTEFLNALIKAEPKIKAVLDGLVAEKTKAAESAAQPAAPQRPAQK